MICAYLTFAHSAHDLRGCSPLYKCEFYYKVLFDFSEHALSGKDINYEVEKFKTVHIATMHNNFCKYYFTRKFLMYKDAMWNSILLHLAVHDKVVIDLNHQ